MVSSLPIRLRRALRVAILAAVLASGCSPPPAVSNPATSTRADCATCQKFITATPQPSPTDTPLPLATESPTPTPYPTLASFYKVHECRSFKAGIPYDGGWYYRAPPISSMWCVLNIKVGLTGTIMLDVYWSARRSDGRPYVSIPPEVPAVIYMIDDSGNKYESTKAGGCALTSTNVQSGKGCSGWLIYPPLKPGVSVVSVYYDKYQLAVEGILLVE